MKNMDQIKESEKSFKENNIDEDSGSFIGKSVKIKGNISSSREISIGGNIKGSVLTGGRIIIEESGNINGEIESDIIEIFGKVKGTLKSNGKITIHSSGVFKGDLYSKIIIIKEGAVFNGTANTGENKI